MRHWLAIGVVVVLATATALFADGGKLTVDVAHPGVKISPSLYGLMTEEINHSYDGGLYAELIQNRTFKDNASKPAHWSVVKADGVDAAIAIDGTDPVNTTALEKSLRLDIKTAGQPAGIANDGYWGIPASPNTKYKASFYARAIKGFSAPLTVRIESNDGVTVIAHATVPSVGDTWKKYEVTLSTGGLQPSTDNRFVISTTGPGSVWFSLVSLFPPTYNNRPNGNRIDIMQKLADMHTAFLRLPGGNYLEGDTIAERFDWKKTIGPLENRPGHQGPWSYRSSDGLGLLEFYGWCEDLKVEPLLAVFAGYALKGAYIKPGPELVPFVQDALDEIEYSIGDASTTWGQRRANDGHLEPFKIRYVEIGNEDWFDKSGSYDGRFAQFFDAIKAKYPQLKLIATASVKSRKPDVIDDHFYRSAHAMERDVHHYDKTPRSGPQIFVGEWATQEGAPTPDMNAALGDAAWLTGLERNSDIVVLSCYAPLLVNVNRNGRQWETNLIGYNAISCFGSPSYYAQKMFNENRGDTVLPVEVTQPKVDPSQESTFHGGVGVGTWATEAEFKDIKVANADTILYQSDFAKGADNWRTRGGAWSVLDGAYRQSSHTTDVCSTVGERGWGDYTYSVKARKISGSEGFMLLFHALDRNNYFWWNLGGWGNTRSALEQVNEGSKAEFGPSVPITIETGRWYDIRIELKGHDMKFYLDDKLVTQAKDPGGAVDPLFATASRVDSSGDVILKVINTSSAAQSIAISLAGAANVSPSATVQVLAGKPADINTIDAPSKIVPQQADVTDAGGSFTHEFPATSVTVMRFKTK